MVEQTKAVESEAITPQPLLIQDKGTDTSQVCPVCRTQMGPEVDPFGGYVCPNATCAFVISDSVQAVVRALIDQGVGIYDACEIALTYTFEPESRKAVEEQFAVTDRKSADWVLKKLAEADGQMAELNEVLEANIAPLQAKIDAIRERASKIIKPILDRRQFFLLAYGNQLEEFARAILQGRKERTEKLINGDLQFKKQPDKTEIYDMDRAVYIAEIHSLLTVDNKKVEPMEIVHTEKSVNKTALKRLFELRPETAELFKGVAEIIEGKDEFKIVPRMPGA